MAAETKVEAKASPATSGAVAIKADLKMHILCMRCDTVVRSGCRCVCSNSLMVKGLEWRAWDERSVSMLNKEMISVSSSYSCLDISTKFMSLLSEPLYIYNGLDERIAVLNPAPHEIKDMSQGMIRSWFSDAGGPIPIVELKLSTAKQEIVGVPFTRPIVASDYQGVILIRSGYTNVYVPDSSPPSAVVLGGKFVGVRRLTKLLA